MSYCESLDLEKNKLLRTMINYFLYLSFSCIVPNGIPKKRYPNKNEMEKKKNDQLFFAQSFN